MFGKIVKISKSGKTALIGAKADKRQIGYTFGWAATVEGDEVGTEIPDFNPTGREPVKDEQGNPVLHEDGAPVLRWVF